MHLDLQLLIWNKMQKKKRLQIEFDQHVSRRGNWKYQFSLILIHNNNLKTNNFHIVGQRLWAASDGGFPLLWTDKNSKIVS